MMRSTPAWKTWVNNAGVIVLASMGRRYSIAVFHIPSIASGERRRGCRLCNRASLCVVAVWAFGSMSTHVYDATVWHALRIASSHVAMPP